MTPLRFLRAANPGPFTLDGTRTYIVGRRTAVILDPGPDLREHVRAVVRSVEGAKRVTVALTHGHGDHAGGVDALMELLPGAELVGPGHWKSRLLAEGETIPTDAGELVTVPTPGHTRDHVAYHWPGEGALFAGDMVLGEGDTTWVAEYPGCVGDYLESLARLEALPLHRVIPTHGPELMDPDAVWARYRAHREGRIAQVRAARAAAPAAGVDELLDHVYGKTLPQGLRGAAWASLEALLHHVEANPGGPDVP